MTDSVAVYPPGWRFEDSNGVPYSGAKFNFYDAGTTNAKTVYSNSGLSSSLGSTVYTDSEGAPVASSGSSTRVLVYTGTAAYKVIITDADDVVLFTIDNIKGALDTSTFLTTSSTTSLNIPVVTVTGDTTLSSTHKGKLVRCNTTSNDIIITLPNAATVGDGWSVMLKKTSGANELFVSGAIDGASQLEIDYLDGAVQIVCDASAFHTTWLRARNAIEPQGYLTLSSTLIALTGDVSAGTAVYYLPAKGNYVPYYDIAGGMLRIQRISTSGLTLTLVASHVANAIYDVFLIGSSNAAVLATGPSWTTVTAGAGARGTGAATAELSRNNDGYLSNAVAATMRNGNTTYSVSAGAGIYIGSLLMDGTNGQISATVTWGQSRKWGVWNYYNRRPIVMKCGDSTATWAYSTGTTRAANNDSNNKIAVFCGMAEEHIDVSVSQLVSLAESGTNNKIASIGVGWNVTNAFSGHAPAFFENFNGTIKANLSGRHVNVPSLGLNNATFCENGGGQTTITFTGTEASMQMVSRYMG